MLTVTSSLRNASRVVAVIAMLASATSAGAQPPRQESTVAIEARALHPAQGVAVVASGTARDDAFTLARAVYGSALRPRRLDELRARILAGDPAPPSATRELRELAELRGAVGGEDAASRKLLASIAQQLGVQALLVVSRAVPPSGEENTGGPTDAGVADLGAADAEAAPRTSTAMVDAGTAAANTGGLVSARLFLPETGEFDAARYEPDASGWGGTVTSLSRRFPPPAAPVAAQLQGPPPKLPSDGKGSRPFYASPWLWGGVGAAVLLGGFFFFASRDTSDDPIHLQMRVPR